MLLFLFLYPFHNCCFLNVFVLLILVNKCMYVCIYVCMCVYRSVLVNVYGCECVCVNVWVTSNIRCRKSNNPEQRCCYALSVSTRKHFSLTGYLPKTGSPVRNPTAVKQIDRWNNRLKAHRHPLSVLSWIATKIFPNNIWTRYRNFLLYFLVWRKKRVLLFQHVFF